MTNRGTTDLILGRDESIIADYSFMSSTLMFFLKGRFILTDHRLVAEKPNLLWNVIPTGQDTVTFPLSNIAGVRISTSVNWKPMVAGFFLLIYIPKIMAKLLGLFLIAASIATEIVITNSGGQAASLPVSIFERDAARRMVSQLNTILADRPGSSKDG